MNTEFLDNAIRFAVEAHRNTPRRGKDFPYIIHPLEAMAIVATISSDPDLLAASVLHDTVEDTDVTIDTIRAKFGARVAEIVFAESDQFEAGVSETDSWHDRKQAAITRLKNASYEAKVVAMGDKLSNMRAIYRDYMTIGDELWSIFHVKDKASHAWHYRGLADSLSELSDTFAYREFIDLINRVFGSEN